MSIEDNLESFVLFGHQQNRKYLIECGDPMSTFRYSPQHWRTWRELNEAFQERISAVDFFPGLILKDKQGQCWRPELQVVLKPIHTKGLV